MSTTIFSGRLPWTDRWTKPSRQTLLEPLKAQHRRQFVHIIEALEARPHIQQDVIWYGPSWKWTIAFQWAPPAATNGSRSRGGKTPQPREPEPFCYLVPNVDNPLVCVPLADDQIERLCRGQLPRYVREAIVNAKCPVSTRWATWTPVTENETNHILQLLGRKYDMTAAKGQGQPQDN